MLPADLPDLMLEIAAKTEFLHAFTNDHEPNAQLRGSRDQVRERFPGLRCRDRRIFKSGAGYRVGGLLWLRWP
jgi:hypothetical protein